MAGCLGAILALPAKDAEPSSYHNVRLTGAKSRGRTAKPQPGWAPSPWKLCPSLSSGSSQGLERGSRKAAPWGKSSPSSPRPLNAPSRENGAHQISSQAATKPCQAAAPQQRKALCPAARNGSSFQRQLPLLPKPPWQLTGVPPSLAFFPSPQA